MASSEARIALPGFGLPVSTLPPWDDEDINSRFPHAIADFIASEGLTLRERRMLDFITQITDKPEWDRKVFDDEIVSKWNSEACRFDPTCDDHFLSQDMFTYCMCELREKATFHKETGLIPVMDAEATVVKSDSIVPGSLRESLALGVRPLEDIPARFKDWHPGSGQMVLDLVHPSLFPIVYGRSRVLPSGRVPLNDCARYTGLGETIPEHNAGRFHVELSFGNTAALRPWGGYQWLPTQIDFTPDGRPSIASYINNLHPAHAGLYKVLEQLVDKSIPLWNECLSWFHKRLRISVSTTSNDDYEIPEGVTWPRPNTNLGPSADNQEAEDEMDDLMWSWEHRFEDDYMEWWEANRVLTYPEPRTFRPANRALQGAGARLVDLKSEYNASGLHVIFKLANIHLTPEKPEYNGGSWHIEGAMNEHICATALYYYDSENIETSYLAFRQSIDVEAMVRKPAQSEHSSACKYFGVEDEGLAIQNLGKISTPQGRLLAFPNVMQHQVQPFRLADASKPGHRKILAMFLVDPHIRVLSTANVPPQQRDWWVQEIRKVDRFSQLPEELFQNIVGFVDDFPFSGKEALEIREKLMEERGGVADDFDQMISEETFSFCEH